jgi:uncharacterized linocin/CFP29 family protein
VTSHLLRELAPISPAGWDAIETDVKPRLATYLAARKLVDFEGPKGWGHSSTTLGRVSDIEAVAPQVDAALRQVRPLVELRGEFTLARRELDDVDRGAPDPDLDALDTAARNLAYAENVAVFQGYAAAGITGIAESSPHDSVALTADFEAAPTSVARAVGALRESGVDGPYGLALGPMMYTGIIETTEHGGYPLLDHLRKILDGPVVWAPGVEGGIVLSLRGGDFVFESGEDISIGYRAHTASDVSLYLEESFTFRVRTPEAAVKLTQPGNG